MIVIAWVTDPIDPGETVVDGMIDAVWSSEGEVGDWYAQKVEKDCVVRTRSEARRNDRLPGFLVFRVPEPRIVDRAAAWVRNIARDVPQEVGERGHSGGSESMAGR